MGRPAEQAKHGTLVVLFARERGTEREESEERRVEREGEGERVRG